MDDEDNRLGKKPREGENKKGNSKRDKKLKWKWAKKGLEREKTAERGKRNEEGIEKESKKKNEREIERKVAEKERKGKK